jgi:hypothetical protein
MQKLRYMKDVEALCCLLLMALEFTRPEIKQMVIEDLPKNKKISDFAKYELIKYLKPNL